MLNSQVFSVITPIQILETFLLLSLMLQPLKTRSTHIPEPHAFKGGATLPQPAT